MPLLSNTEMGLGALGEGLKSFTQAFRQGRSDRLEREQFEENKKYKDAEFALKAAEQGKVFDPYSGTISEAKDGMNPKKQREDLDVLSKVYSGLSEDQKVSPEGAAIRNKLYQLISPKIGSDSSPMAQTVAPASVAPNGFMPEESPIAPVVEASTETRKPFALAPGQLSKEDKEWEKRVREKEFDAALEARKVKAPKPLTATEVSEISSLESAIKGLDDIDQIIDKNQDKFGFFVGNVGKLNPKDERAQTINTSLGISRQKVGKGLEGGKLAEGDAKRYSGMLADLGNDPKVAKNKIALVRRDLINERNNKIKNFGKSGYMTDKYQDWEIPGLPESISGYSKGNYKNPLTGDALSVGDVVNGMKYKGGNPNDRKNWGK